MKNIFTSFVILCTALNMSFAQEKYAILIAGEYNPANIAFPAIEQWNNGLHPASPVFDEFWNDTYLMWEMLVKPVAQGGKGYTDQNVHVLFANNDDFTFPEQADRYTPSYNGYTKVTDDWATKSSISSNLSALATTITKNDYLFVWIMSHGGTDAQGSYFYSYDAQKVYDTELAGWLNSINAYKKTVVLSFPSSGGFASELQGERTTVIASSQVGETSSRADNLAPGGAFTENEVINTVNYNHGEANYHLYSSLNGETPDFLSTYAGDDLENADLNDDAFTSIGESYDWLVAKKTTGESVSVNDLSNVINYTDLRIPTILFGIINQDMLIRGLCSITIPETHIASNKTFTFDGSIEFIDKGDNIGTLYLDLNSNAVINNNASILIPTDNIVINGNLNFGDNVIYKSDRCNLILNQKNIETIYGLDFENINENSYIVALDIQTRMFLYVRGSLFTPGTKVIGKPVNISIDCTVFVKSIVNFIDPYDLYNKAEIDSCFFTGIYNPYANLSTIYLNGYESFKITYSKITTCGRDGITLDYCGLQPSIESPSLVKKDTVFDNENEHSNCVGITINSSFCEIRNNLVARNNFGIISYGNSKVLLEGNANANYSNETQQIRSNTGVQVSSADETSFPYMFKWNFVQVENDDESEVLLNSTKCKIHSIENNYWGEIYKSENVEKYFYPLNCFDWEPTWALIPESVDQSEDELIYNYAIAQFEAQDFSGSKETINSLMNLYPQSEFTETAMKDLIVIENETSQDLQSLIGFYQNDSSINNNENLLKLGKALTNKCLILDGDYETALNNYYTELNDSITYNDSIIILSNIEYINYLIENSQGYKSGQSIDNFLNTARSDCEFQKMSTYYKNLLLNPLSQDLQDRITRLKNGELTQNFPNPVKSLTTIYYRLYGPGQIALKIYNYSGQLIKTYDLGYNEEGIYNFDFETVYLPNGLYLYNLEMNGIITDTKKMAVFK